eukprot:gene8881-9831_t
MASELHNKMVDACVVVGMDEQTGLLPIPNLSSQNNNADHSLANSHGPFQTNVLAVLTGTTAFFPCQLTQIPAGDFYPEEQVICPAASTNMPTARHSKKLRRSLSYAPTNMPFSAEVIQSLPPFCFPDGGFTYKTAKEPYMHYLVLTNIDGGRSYVCALIVTRPFSVMNFDQYTGVCDLDLPESPREVNEDEVIHYVPFCICLVSKSPYFNAMKNLLSSLTPDLVRGENRDNDVSIWTHVMKFASQVSCIAVPPAGELSIEVELLGNRVMIPGADEPDRSVVDFDLHLPMLMLSIEDMLKVIAAILTEQRLIFISSNQALIPLVIECFFAFIEPFKWRRPYVPILPAKLVDLIEAPGPFIMGCHSRLRTHIKQVIRMEEIPAIVIVDLDKQTIDTNSRESLELLPDFASQALSVRLRKARYQYDIELMTVPTFYDIREANKHRQRFVDIFARDVKTACLDMMVSLFADVVLFMKVSDQFFDKDGYLQSKLSQDYNFYHEACATDAFDRFIDNRLENPSRRDTFSMLAEKVCGTTTRKRSTSNITMSNRKGFTLGTIASFSNKKIVFKQPLLLENEGPHTGAYFKRFIEKLTAEIEGASSKNISLKASLLYLRGMLYSAVKQPIEGLKDFYALYSASQQLFPTSYVQHVVSNLDEDTEKELNQQEFFTRAAMFRMFAKRTEEQQPERPTRKLPTSPVARVEFLQRVKALLIAESDETAEWLFVALESNDSVSPERFTHLYNMFIKAERELQAIKIPGVKLDDTERVIACSPLVNTTSGMGRIIITSKQLFFVAVADRDSTLVTKLEDIKEVIKYQHYVVLPPGVAALRIVNKDPRIAPFFVCLKENRNLWVSLLYEMNGGHEAAVALKEPKLIEQASNNVILTTVLQQMDLCGSVADGPCYFARQRASDRQELSEQTRDALERWLDPCIRETKKSTVMSVTYVQGRVAGDPATVWCGLGSGSIMVYEVEGWTCVSELRYAKNRISCLSPVGNGMVWAGSFDSVIYVIDTDTRMAEQQLQNHNDFISDIIYVEASEHVNTMCGRDLVWSATFSGEIIKWNPETRESYQKISLGKVKTLARLMIVGDRLWCASSDCLFVVDPHTGAVMKQLKQYDHRNYPVMMECFCKVSDKQVWAFGRQGNKLFVWNTKSYECQTVETHDNVKASTILSLSNREDEVWIGCKDGKVLVMNSKDYSCDFEFHAHIDAVKSMCMTEEGHVVTGSSSKEGKMCIWNMTTRDRYQDPSTLGFDVVDRGHSLTVKSKVRVRKLTG